MNRYDVAVIGGGPGGYVAAIRSGRLGMKTALIEAGALGGMCLNWGCIPAKALLETAHRFEQVRDAARMGIVGVDRRSLSVDWPKALSRMKRIVARLSKGVEYLEKKNSVDVIKGRAEPQGGGLIRVRDRVFEAKKIILATGSRPGRKAVENARSRAIEIDAFWRLDKLPEQGAVWGHGPVAVEIALLLALVGVKTELLSSVEKLLPGLDGDLGRYAAKRLKKAGVTLRLGRTIQQEEADGLLLDDGSSVGADIVVNGAERLPVLQSLAKLGLEKEGEFVKIDSFGRTSSDGVYAVGDLTGKAMLAHAASAQGVAAVNHIAGIEEPVDFEKIPWNIYLYPEIASVGLSEEALGERGIEYDKGVFPLTANSKAVLQAETDGFVKVLADRKYGEVLGVHIVAPRATDMIGEACLAMRLESTILDVASVVHAHPTLSETMLEASLGAREMAIHI